MDIIPGVSYIFIKRSNSGEIEFILTKIADDLLFVGIIANMERFVGRIKKPFMVSKVIDYGTILFNGCRIQQDETGGIRIEMGTYVDSNKQMNIPLVRRKQAPEKATTEEYNDSRSLVGSVIYGQGAAAFLMQLLWDPRSSK